MLTHAQVWGGIDALAKRMEITPSALAKLAGLDPTSFNRSKRVSTETPPRPRWPSTESLAKVLSAAGVQLAEFGELAVGGRAPLRAAPLLGFAQAGRDGFFDDAGFPTCVGWDEVALPGVEDGAYALEITGDSMTPLYREGDRVIVRPLAGEPPRRGDRVVVKTLAGEVTAKEVARVTARRITLRSLNPAHPERTLELKEVAWIARILWASQ